MTASTERSPRPLSVADLPGCLALSGAAQWNQNEADWRMMLEMGQGWGIDGTADGSGGLAASIVVIPYGSFAWVSMVLVLPPFRQQGLAARLLRHALDWLHARRILPILDATPAGYPVYEKAEFIPTWGFQRYRREATGPAAADVNGAAVAGSPRIRALAPADWPAILALDAAAFGASRESLLRRLADRLPAAARVAEVSVDAVDAVDAVAAESAGNAGNAGRITGFLLGRDGREACQLGPLIAENDAAARCLLDDALAAIAAPVHVDLTDRHEHLDGWLRQRGFAPQRRLTRMIRGASRTPGDAARMVLVAGPELG